MALPPCHVLSQFYVRNNTLSCHLFQRSGDAFLGIPFNIASYSILTAMIAQVCNLKVGEFLHSITDLHIYSNHYEQVKEQISRKGFELPTLLLNSEIKCIDYFKMDDFKLINYQSDPTIKGEMAV